MDGDAGIVEVFKPEHPYQPAGQVCRDIEGRKGPTDLGQWSVYDTCLIPLAYQRVAIAATITAAGDPIVVAAFAGDNALEAFTSGAGGLITGSKTGYPATIQGGVISKVDTSNKQQAPGTGGSPAPDNDLVWRGWGFSVGLQNFFTVANERKSFRPAWFQAYRSEFELALLSELNLSMRFGGTIADQNLGAPHIYRVANLRDSLPQAGEGVWTRCHFLSGAPNDSDRLRFKVENPFAFEIQNDGGSPTPSSTTLYGQLVINMWGLLECRTTGGVCMTPGEKAAGNLEKRVDQLTSMLQQVLAQGRR